METFRINCPNLVSGQNALQHNIWLAECCRGVDSLRSPISTLHCTVSYTFTEHGNAYDPPVTLHYCTVFSSLYPVLSPRCRSNRESSTWTPRTAWAWWATSRSSPTTRWPSTGTPSTPPLKLILPFNVFPLISGNHPCVYLL